MPRSCTHDFQILIVPKYNGTALQFNLQMQTKVCVALQEADNVALCLQFPIKMFCFSAFLYLDEAQKVLAVGSKKNWLECSH